MALYARYPIGQAPGMGENFFFVLTVIPAAAAAGFADPWRVALGVVFVAGVLFLLITLAGLRQVIVDSISPSMKHAIAVGIGLFIALIGLQNATLVQIDQTLSMNTEFASPDLAIFFFGLLATGALHARGTRGAIPWGIAITTLLSVGLKLLLDGGAASPVVADSMLMTRFAIADRVVSAPPSLAPTFLQMDVVGAMTAAMVPFIVIFLVMDVFDTIGTIVAVGERAGFVRNNRLPRARQAMLSDAVGTTVGACLGTSTVTSFIESATGVEEGARTGLASLVTASLFLLALFLSPVVAMVAGYPPITAPALVLVGSLMVGNAAKVEWSDAGESLPAFLTIVGIPLTYSIADGLALGIISYPIVKVASGRARDVRWPMYGLAALLIPYYIFIRAQAS
jgi:AGZA family xanthine/uracil permease-like MFS transporter